MMSVGYLITSAKLNVVLRMLLLLVNFGIAQKESPCHKVFQYDEQRDLQSGKWFGLITLQSHEDLEGIWLGISLDQPAESFGNWFGDSTTKNNKYFDVRNNDFQLKSNEPAKVKFYVKFNLTGPIPSLSNIKLNGRSLCPVHASKGQIFDTVEVSTNSAIIERKGRNEFELPDEPCGVISQQIRPLIIKGFDTSEGQFPWHVAIYLTDGNKISQYICGGSLISKRHIITAAHCVTVPKTKILTNITRLHIYLGTSNLFNFANGVQFDQPKAINLHPNFDTSYYFNDIAIVEMRNPAQITDYVKTVCLWDANDNVAIENLYNKSGLVVGWGQDGENSKTDILKGTYMPIVDTQSCIWSNRAFFSRVTFEKNFCAGVRGGPNVCIGDSGGGMVFKRNGTTLEGPVIWQLRGVVSIGAAKENTKTCDPNHYSLFTDVAKYLEWIQTVINKIS